MTDILASLCIALIILTIMVANAVTAIWFYIVAGVYGLCIGIAACIEVNRNPVKGVKGVRG